MKRRQEKNTKDAHPKKPKNNSEDYAFKPPKTATVEKVIFMNFFYGLFVLLIGFVCGHNYSTNRSFFSF